MTRHKLAPNDHERLLTCTSCGAQILVCGHITDLDPRTFRGLACGCRKVKTDAQLRAQEQVEHARKTRDVIPF